MLKIINYNSDEYDFPALVVLGCFDAVHVGHQALLKKAKLNAKINGLDLGVMMFARGKGGRQVFTFEERLAMLEQYNAKFVLRIDYDDEFKKTSAQDFLAAIEQHVNLKGYMSGKDFRFGAGAKGKSSTLKKYAEDEDNAVWYEAVKDVMLDGEKVSTTLIKQCLEEGKVSKAAELLGRRFFLSGEVCEGHGRGRQLGFPTANIVYPADKVLVAPGVYGVEAEIDGAVYKGVANCGPRPTFGEDAYALEVYFEGLSEDLYGKTVTVRFVNYIRGIRKFATAEELAAQIAKDAGCIGTPDAPVEEVTEEIAEETPVEEVTEEVAEETPVEEVTEEVAEETPVEEVTEEVAEETPVEEVAEEVAEKTPVEEVTEEVAEETPAEEATEEVAEETPVEEATEEVAEETPVEEVTEEVAEETPVEEVTEEVAEETPVEEAAEEVAEETPVEEVTEEVAEETPVEEVAEEAPAEEAAEEAAEETPVEEVTEEVAEETPVEEVTEEVAEETPVEEAAEEVAEETPAEEVTEEVAEETPVEEVTEEVTEETPVEEVTEEVAVAEESEEGEEGAAEDTAVEERSGKKKRRKGRGKSDRRKGKR